MSPSTPFVDRETGTLDTTQILVESFLLAKLIGFFVALALVPFGLVFLALGNSALGALFVVAGQFVLAVGAGVVLIYVVVRAMQLAEMT